MTELTLSKAEEYANKAIAKAREMGVSVCVAIVDKGSKLVALLRMDDLGWITVNYAIGKAYTALAFGKSTKTMTERFKNSPLTEFEFLDNLFRSSVSSGKICLSPGGVLIKINGEIIGAIGVSGAHDEQDHEIAVKACILNEKTQYEGS